MKSKLLHSQVPTIVGQQLNLHDSGLYVLHYLRALVDKRDLSFSRDDLTDKFKAKLRDDPAFQIETSDISKLRQDAFTLLTNIKSRYDALPIDDKRSCVEESDAMNIDVSDVADSDSATPQLCQPCEEAYPVPNPDEMESVPDLSLRPGFSIYYRSVNERDFGSGLVLEILPERTDIASRVVLSNGFNLTETHEICITKVRVQSSGKLVMNPDPEWKPVGEYHLLTGVFKDSQLLCPDLNVKRAKQNKNDRIRNSKGATKQQFVVEKRGINKYHADLDRKRKLPFFFERLRGNPKEYRKQIKALNTYYKKLLNYGKLDRMPSLLEVSSLGELESAKKNLKRNISSYKTTKYVELNLPDERKVQFIDPAGRNETNTNREQTLEEKMLMMEHTMKCLSILVCPSCRENIMVSNPSEYTKSRTFVPNAKQKATCERCKKLPRPDHYLYNNLHPIWYEHDDEGNLILDSKGKPIIHYEIPPELSELTVPEKMLIRRYAPYIPSFHVSKGNFAIRGNCVTFPQDITEACNVLPRMKKSVVTFIRQLKSNTSTQTSAKQYKVNRDRVLKALQWLKRHHDGYKDITINMDNLWFEGEEVNILDDATTFNMDEGPKQQVERVSQAHDKDLGDVEPEEGFEISTMHTNEEVTVPRGAPTEPIVDLINTAEETNQMDKVLEFPPISTEPVS
jgi:uncharacterized protein YbaR (Trm112 family)